jgi:hypothetical protein
VEAWVLGIFCNFNLVKKAQIYNDSRATEVRENMSTGLLFFDVGFNQFLLNVISHGFLVTTKLKVVVFSSYLICDESSDDTEHGRHDKD